MSIQLPEGTKYEYLTLGMNAFRHKHTETESCATLKVESIKSQSIKSHAPCMAKLWMPPAWQNWGCPSNSQTHELHL